MLPKGNMPRKRPFRLIDQCYASAGENREEHRKQRSENPAYPYEEDEEQGKSDSGADTA